MGLFDNIAVKSTLKEHRNRITLFQRHESYTPNNKKYRIWEALRIGNNITVEYGVDGSDNKVCESKDIPALFTPGHASYQTPEENAKIELARLIKEKQGKGYRETKEEVDEAEKMGVFKLLQDFLERKKFAPCKPISAKPSTNPKDPLCTTLNSALQKIEDRGSLVAQVKRNGIRAYFVFIKNGESLLFSRKMKEIHEHFPTIFSQMNKFAELGKIDNLSIIDLEITLGEGFTNKQASTVTAMAPNTKPEEARRIYSKWLEKYPDQPLMANLFDVLYWGGEEVISQECYETRHGILQLHQDRQYFKNVEENHKAYFRVVENLSFQDGLKFIKENRCEGLVLKDLNAFGSINLNGNPSRPKGQWKWKNINETDCFVVDTKPEKGNESLVGALKIAQYDDNGRIIQRGFVGSGLTDTDKDQSWIGKVVEIIYDDVWPENKDGEFCFQNPRFVRSRPDKRKEECLFDYCVNED